MIFIPLVKQRGETFEIKQKTMKKKDDNQIKSTNRNSFNPSPIMSFHWRKKTWNNKIYFSTNNRSQYDWAHILGKRGALIPPYQLANKYIKDDKIITSVEVNKVLAFSGITITQYMLDKILERPRLCFSNLDSNTIRSDMFLQYVGTVRGKVQIPGVYIWTHLSTGDMYVGSSSALARRLIGYFNNTDRNTGKLIPLIKKQGVGAFSLKVIPLTVSYFVKQELSLEQYFLLHSKFNLNTLKVVNDISGVVSKPLYMYTKDLSELIYSSDIQEDFIFKLNIHHSTFSNSLNTGAVYLDKYIFTDKPVVGAVESNMSEADIKIILDKERIKLKQKVIFGRKVVIKAADNSITKLFNSISDCISYLNSIAPSNKTTLYRHIESKRLYRGYMCEWGSEETTPIINKSMQVNVTHMPSGKTVTYPTTRKAALSFAPEYLTTGPTLKAYALSGKLFKGIYKISNVCLNK